MPLVKSASRAAVSQNIKTEMAANKPQAQAVAIALDVARRAKRAMGGSVFQPPTATAHTGPIMSAIPGRTDRHNMSVKSGSYIIPAETVSHLGENNSAAGMKILNRMFSPGSKFGASEDALGIPGWTQQHSGTADAGGGRGKGTGELVPIITAGGEYSVPPHIVAKIGGGSVKRGHKILDTWVMKMRKEHIRTLQKLAPPVKS